MRRVLALSLRIIRQFVRDRRSLVLLFVVPLFVMTILNFVLNNSSNSIMLGVVPPQGVVGQQIVQQLQSRLSGQPGVTLKTVDANAVDTTLKNGDADGVLVFPADFATQLASGQSPTLTLRLEGSNPAVAQQLRSLTTLLAGSLAQHSSGATAATPSATALTVQTTYLYGGPEYTQTDALAPLFIGLFSFFFVFLLTSVAFLRERSQGTLERLRVSPLSRTELVLGYVIGFTLFALLQSAVILLFVVGVLRVHYAGNLALLFLVTLVLTISAVNLGIFASAFARTELQVVQFIPLVLVPQALLGGLFFPVATLPVVLKQAAYVMPITYANFALRDVMLKGYGIDQIWGDLAFLVGFALLMVIGAALSLRQERA